MNQSSGKVSVLTIAVGAAVLLLAVVFDPLAPRNGYHQVFADTATTTVTVLNTPPLWSVDAQEAIESSTSTPTNVDEGVAWIGTASDSNNEAYYLLVCKSSSTPTPNAGASPTCGGGASNLWAVSTSTAADVQARSTYTASSTDVESNAWFAWICDGNASNPQCNSTFKQGTGTSSSPFLVNHRPNFTSTIDTSPANPGAVVTWTTSSSDPDVVSVADQVQLFVCRASDFNNSTSAPACGAGGTYCTSTLATTNATCSSTLSTPLQDRNYNAHTYITDNHNLRSIGLAQATDTVVVVNNVAPTISSSSISVNDTDDVGNLTLAVPQGETTGFRLRFTVADNNSCSSTLNVPEVIVTSTVLNVYRSGVGSSSCQTSGNYNPRSCYPSAAGSSTWGFFCSQDTGSCTGSSDSDATFLCSFPLWYVADPTDGTSSDDSQFPSQNWLSTVQATDDDLATSSLVEASQGNELSSFLAYALSNASSIAYGSLQPGSTTDPLFATTTVKATGNVGLDETIYGDHMCTTYPTCSAGSTTSTIQIHYQHYATSAVGYNSSSAVTATTTPGLELEINILKTTQTSSPAVGTVFWGIQVPITLTLAGDYTGKNTLIGIKGEASFW